VANAATGTDHEPVAIKNPLGSDYGIMRTSLLSGLAVNDLSSGLLNVACRNANLGAPSARLFEVGPVYSSKGEETQLALLIAGAAEPVSWLSNRPRSLNLFDLRGTIEALLPAATLELDQVESSELPLAADVCVKLSGNTIRVGRIGLCSPAVARKIGYDAVMVAELSLKLIEKVASRQTKFQPISPYPAITRDVAMEIDAHVPGKTVDHFFQTYKESLLESFSLFDVFSDPSGKKLDATKKSLAYSLTYRSKDKTLKSEDVDKAHARLLTSLQGKLGVTLR
jgi:phenylalanyl-tRNA synthetase beta chain